MHFLLGSKAWSTDRWKAPVLAMDEKEFIKLSAEDRRSRAKIQVDVRAGVCLVDLRPSLSADEVLTWLNAQNPSVDQEKLIDVQFYLCYSTTSTSPVMFYGTTNDDDRKRFAFRFLYPAMTFALYLSEVLLSQPSQVALVRVSIGSEAH